MRIGVSVSMLALGLMSIGPAFSAPDGGAMFKAKCAMCHPGGGNRMDPSKPVKGSKTLKSKQTFKDYLSVKNGMMPAFPQIADNDAALTALYEYVKGLK